MVTPLKIQVKGRFEKDSELSLVRSGLSRRNLRWTVAHMKPG